MILPQQDNNIETICKDCVFSEYNGILQTGCTANRLETFKEESVIEAHDGEKMFYVIKGICNSYRPPVWNSGVADIDKMKDELRASFSIILDVDKYSRDELLEMKRLIADIFYYENVDVTLAHKGTYANKDIISQIVRRWLGQKKIRIVQYNDSLTKFEIDNELLKKVRGNFFSMSPLKDTTVSLMRSIDHAVQSYKRFIVSTKSDSVFVMSSTLRFYKMTEDKTYKDFESALLDGAELAKLHLKF